MLFNSLEFLVFLPMVVAMFLACPHRWRWVLMLVASYYFYMCWEPEYAMLILASTCIDYVAALQMGKQTEKAKRKPWLLLSLVTNLGLLGFFKYANFFSSSTEAVLGQFNILANLPEFEMLLPVGISFYTFQTISYTVEVYRGNIEPERHFGYFAVFVSYFPQLVAGPIERPQNLLPQLKKEYQFDYTLVRNGILLVVWGFFKKVVVSDRIGEYVNVVFDAPANFGFGQIILSGYFFLFQLYCDFSGYSDIAIGTAAILGVRLMQNFRRPFFAVSAQDLWSRWHISLSTWFRDYVYILLGGNRTKKPRWLVNLLITFLLSGLWHGAGWTFVLWGAFHGIWLIVSFLTKPFWDKALNINNKWARVVRTLGVFHLLMFSMIIFRADGMHSLLEIISGFFRSSQGPINLFSAPVDLGISIGLLMLLVLIEFLQEKQLLAKAVWETPRIVRWSLFVGLLLVLIGLGRMETQDFIYFQF